MNTKKTVVAYIVDRLAQLGITDCFGLPGDYAFPFDDAIVQNKKIKWRGCANELNAAYAADGYARVRGAALLCTTYAVGELSALNGMMGAYAERLPVFHLVGMPSMRLQLQRKITHHTFGDGVFQNYINISAQATCAYAIVTAENCIYEMERIIQTALAESRPAYIIVAEDVAYMPVVGDDLKPFAPPTSNQQELKAAVDAAVAMIDKAESGCILPCFTVSRMGLQKKLLALVEASGLPYATTSMDKSTLPETHTQFIGGYAGGGFSAENVTEAIEGGDVVIDVGGVLFTDLSTAGFASNIDPKKMISLGIDTTRIGDKYFINVRLEDVLTELTKRVKKFKTTYKNPAAMEMVGNADDAITWASLAPRYEKFIKANDILFVETGTSASALGGMKLPDGVAYHNQGLWGAIGWSTPAAMGAAIADTSRRVVLITGEGAHQLTANEIGSYKRHGLKPIIFVLNNKGFAVERVLEDYPDWEYNDLAQWNYHTLPAAMGCTDWFTVKATTNAELDAAMEKAGKADTACYIEVVTDEHDYPAGARVLHTRYAEMYEVKPG